MQWSLRCSSIHVQSVVVHSSLEGSEVVLNSSGSIWSDGAIAEGAVVFSRAVAENVVGIGRAGECFRGEWEWRSIWQYSDRVQWGRKCNGARWGSGKEW